jgi:hypothetical protein
VNLERWASLRVPSTEPPPVPDRVQTGQVLIPGLLLGFAVNAVIERWPFWVALVLVALAVPMPWLLAVFSRFLQRRRFGVSELVLDRVPWIPGQRGGGTIVVPRAVPGMAAARLALQCVDHGKLLLLAEDTTAHPRVEADRTLLSFVFDIPEQGPESDGRHVTWRVHVGAATDGIDYQEYFEVPVCRTASSTSE